MMDPTPLGLQFFEKLADEITLPESVYERATEHYEAVGRWLDGHSSRLRRFRVTIYPQGSIALGTAIRPLRDGEHDVDAVCLLEKPPPAISQQDLKGMIGDRLREHQKYRFMLNPRAGGRRCWTLKYRDSPAFHLDILPAIPDDPRWLIDRAVPKSWADTAIRITDTTTWLTGGSWPRSNPKGFQAWFRDRMREQLREAKMMLQPEIRSEGELLKDLEQIPDYRVRTPLQCAVQILKFHRDSEFEGNAHKPISIIITTLAARSYQGEGTVGETLSAIVPRMRDGIERINGSYRIENPVDPRENFADKWSEEPVKARTFFRWLEKAEDAVQRLSRSASLAALSDGATRGFSHTYARSALEETVRANEGSGSVSGFAAASVLVPSKLSGATYPKTEVPRQPARPWRHR